MAYSLPLLLSAAALFIAARAYPSGGVGCSDEPNHGAAQTSGSGGYSLRLRDPLAGTVTAWAADTTYAVDLTGASSFKGFYLYIEDAQGTRIAVTPGSAAVSQSTCDGLTHRNTNAKTLVTAGLASGMLTSGMGSITLRATVVVSYNTWYKVSLVIPEEGAADPTGSDTPSVSASATRTATASGSRTGSRTPSPSGTCTGTQSGTPSSTITASNTPSSTASLSPGASPSRTPSGSPTASITASGTATSSPTPTGSGTPTGTPSGTLTLAASPTPSVTRTQSPTPSASVVALAPGSCPLGYAGPPACSACALGYSSSGGRCVEAVPSDGTAQAVRATVGGLKLDLPFAQAGEPGTPTRTAFETSLVNDVCAALNVSASSGRVAVVGLKAGSIIATLEILPAPAGSAATAPTVGALAASLLAAYRSPSSALYAGWLTQNLVPGTPLTLAVGPTYTHSGALSPVLRLDWSVDSAAGLLYCRLSSSVAGGWAAMSLNSEANAMAGGDAVVVQPALATAANPAAAVRQHSITGNDGPFVVPLSSAQSTITRVAFVDRGTAGWSAEFARPLSAGTYANARPVTGGGNLYAVAAWGSSSSMANHGSNTASARFDAVAGTLTPVAGGTAQVLRTAHGALMFIAWGVLLPLGAGVARFGKSLGASAAKAPAPGTAADAAAPPAVAPAPHVPFWFQFHRVVQCLGWVMMLAAFGLTVAAVPSGSAHFATPHGALGLTVVILGALQPFLAAVRPAKTAPGQQRTAARFLWEMAHKFVLGWAVLLALAPAAIFTGLTAFAAAQGLTIAYAVWLALVLCLLAALAARDLVAVLRARGRSVATAPSSPPRASSLRSLAVKEVPDAVVPQPPSASAAALAGFRAPSISGRGSSAGVTGGAAVNAAWSLAHGPASAGGATVEISLDPVATPSAKQGAAAPAGASGPSPPRERASPSRVRR